MAPMGAEHEIRLYMLSIRNIIRRSPFPFHPPLQFPIWDKRRFSTLSVVFSSFLLSLVCLSLSSNWPQLLFWAPWQLILEDGLLCIRGTICLKSTFFSLMYVNPLDPRHSTVGHFYDIQYLFHSRSETNQNHRNWDAPHNLYPLLLMLKRELILKSCPRILESSPHILRVRRLVSLTDWNSFILLSVSFGGWTLGSQICTPYLPPYDSPYFRKSLVTCHLIQTATAVSATCWYLFSTPPNSLMVGYVG